MQQPKADESPSVENFAKSPFTPINVTMKQNKNTPETEFQRLMDEIDKAIQDNRGKSKPSTAEVTKSIAKKMLDEFPNLIVFQRQDASNLSDLVLEVAGLLTELTKLLDPDNDVAIDGIMERVEELLQVHENLENAIDSLDD